MINITVQLAEGASTKLRWHPNTADDSIATLICVAVGLNHEVNIILEDSEGYLVPCFGQHLKSGHTYTVREAPGVRLPLAQNIEDIPADNGKNNSLLKFEQSIELSNISLGESRISSILEPLLDDRMAKFERMNSHLANERTYLAWIRTSISVAGVAVTYSSIASHREHLFYWGGSVYVWMTGVVIFIVGCSRYYQVKYVLGLTKNEITNRFKRKGITLIVGMFSFFLIFLTAEYMGALYRNVS